MLVAENISKKYGDKVAVNNLSFTVKKGEMLALLGSNGAGKTTTFRMILGMISPDTGSVKFDGKIITASNSSNVGFLPEERSLLQKLTINEQLLFFGELKGLKPSHMSPIIDSCLQRFDLFEYKHKKMKELSKGNQQKIQFISATMHSPKLLILDEPFSGLDPMNISLFKQSILELRESGTCIVFSSHRLDYVQSFCEDIIVLIDGVDTINGKVSEIRKNADEYTISIVGEVDVESIRNTQGVIAVEEGTNDMLVRIENYENVKDVYNIVKQSEYIEEFKVNLPTLEEVIVKKVGEFNADK